MTRRITIECLASGQPRPYADSRYHYRVKFEYFMAWLGDPKDERSEWKPMTYFDDDNKKKALVKLLRALKIGYPDDTPEGWWSPKLQWLKLVEPGVWEFYYTEAYTD